MPSAMRCDARCLLPLALPIQGTSNSPQGKKKKEKEKEKEKEEKPTATAKLSDYQQNDWNSRPPGQTGTLARDAVVGWRMKPRKSSMEATAEEPRFSAAWPSLFFHFRLFSLACMNHESMNGVVSTPKREFASVIAGTSSHPCSGKVLSSPAPPERSAAGISF